MATALRLPRADRAGALVLAVLREHQPLIAAVLVYLFAAEVAATIFGTRYLLSLSLYSERLITITASFGVAFVLGHAIYVMAVVRPKRLTRHIVDDLTGKYLTGERVLSILIVLVILPLFLSAFTSVKSMIPVIQPFTWDPEFARLDRWLHFGWQPWELLQPILGRPLISSAVNAIYNGWFFVLYAVLLWQAATLKERALRMRFLVAFVMMWAVVGSCGGTLLSSAGPVYYGRITGLPDPYAPLMEYLYRASESVPIWSLEIQELLWDGYVAGAAGPGSGISAMPSMHVAAATLFAIIGWCRHRWLGIALTAHLALIMIGSVHIGWHYAIDGYLAIPLTYVVWVVTGRLLARTNTRP